MAIMVWYRNPYNTKSRRLDPAPLIQIQPEFYYANDNVIGYTYNVTLKGYAAGRETPSQESDFANTITSIDEVRKIFDENGGDLEVWEEPDTGEKSSEYRKILEAKGALIKKVDFRNSPNYWTNYAEYIIDLEFNEIDTLGCEGNPEIICDSGIFDRTSFPQNLVDLNKYKIKQFTDGWDFSISDETEEIDSDAYNKIIELSYNISATGKSYYNVANKNSGGTMLPAWEQAKNFVQDRLYNEIDKSLRYMLINETDIEQPTSKLQHLFQKDATKRGTLENLNFVQNGAFTHRYKIYDEMIDCSTSESKGTFSANYKCKLKRHNPDYDDIINSVIHTYRKSINITNEQQYQHVITVNGEIQGLLPGSILDAKNETRSGYSFKEGQFFMLPKNGKFITGLHHQNTMTKYEFAVRHYKQLVGTEFDLYDRIKKKLGITYSELGIYYLPEIDRGSFVATTASEVYPLASTFDMTHDYNKGVLTYEAKYDSSMATGLKRGYVSVNIVRNDPVDQIAEYIIPGRAEGPIIQKLNMKSEKTISISINGAHPFNRFCVTKESFSNTNLCQMLSDGPYHNIDNIISIIKGESNDWIRTKKDFSVNTSDGSFSINLEFLCVGHMR